jgi:predicted ribosomally synthesized peptide with SipW-like signal peptide
MYRNNLNLTKIFDKLGEYKMFKGKSLPVGTLFMVLVIMLALLGVGYALWSDTLVIEGQVQTGEVDMAFSPCETDDDGIEDDGIDPGGKDVASCECALSTGSIEDDSDHGNDQLDITIAGGYPSYSCNVTYDMTNIGTVPVHLYSVTALYDVYALDVEQDCWVGEESVGIGYQLHPGDSVDCDIDLHVRQEAAENDTLTLHKEYLWGQFNEGPFYVLSNEFSYNGSGGWAGWSCPLGSILVDGGYLPETADNTVSMKWAPGASVDGVNYPATPWGGYTYDDTYTPPEEGWIVQDGGAPGSPNPNVPTHIFLWCTYP